MRYSVLFIAFLLWNTARAQVPVLLKDEFNDNANGWWTGNGDHFSMKMEGGKYIITTLLKDNGRLATLTPYFDKQKDFSMEPHLFKSLAAIIMVLGYYGGEMTMGSIRSL